MIVESVIMRNGQTLLKGRAISDNFIKQVCHEGDRAVPRACRAQGIACASEQLLVRPSCCRVAHAAS